MAVVSPHTKLATIEDLFRLNYRPLCMFALHYLQDADLVEDVVQECFTVLWEKLEQGADVANRRAYLYTSVRNRCLDQLRHVIYYTDGIWAPDTCVL